MKRLALIAASMILTAAAAFAQAPRTAQVAAAQRDPAPLHVQTPSLANLTPEIWLYLQERDRHDDPDQSVRRKAQERAAQRSHRLAARKWFGFSNVRPTASPIPTMGTYSPFWAGNDSDPNRWNGVGPATIIEVQEQGPYLR